MKKSNFLVVGVSLLFFVVIGVFLGCGPKKPSYEERIKALEEKGVPDSMLASVKVYLYNTKSLAKTGQAGKARQYKDSLKTGLALVEGWYEETMKKNKPIVDSLRKSFVERKASLSGLPLA
ncbi:MAG: hypothetical protein N2053_12770, partial [Chitinispirillaceae bacterium]|nr:hypothetical protein [Chitinispirillaceae bacterium]